MGIIGADGLQFLAHSETVLLDLALKHDGFTVPIFLLSERFADCLQ